MTDDGDAVEYVTPSRDYLRSRLQQMDPYDFETFVADVWTHLGWSTRVVGKPGDRGIDVIHKPHRLPRPVVENDCAG